MTIRPPDLTPADWSAIVDALHYAADDYGYDLYETRSSDFYDAEERAERERTQANWNRLRGLVAPWCEED